MKKLSLIFLALIATTALWASKVITYTATNKLPEVTYTYDSGIHLNAFNVAITDHTFSDGKGTITFAGEVTNIGERAFYRCTHLISIAIPNSVKRMEWGTFYGCDSLTYITIGSGMNKIGDCFPGCYSLSSIDVDPSNTRYASVDGVLYSYAKDTLFYYPIGNPRTDYTIPSSVSYIERNTFEDCQSLTSIHVAPGNTHYTSIDGAVYNYDKDTLIAYPISSKHSDCVIPSSVKYIRDNAFIISSAPTSITCYATTPPIPAKYGIINIPTSIPLYVPASSVETYKAANQWSAFTNILPVECIDNKPCYYSDTMYTCEGNPIKWRRRYYENNGTYYDTLCNQYGCDSIIYILHLTTYPKYQYDTTMYLCANDEFLWRDRIIIKHSGKQDTTYSDTLITCTGCDSIFQLTCHFNPSYYEVIYDTINAGESHECGNITQTGIYGRSYKSYWGCDSIQEWHIYVNVEKYTVSTAVNNTKYGYVEGAGTYVKDSVIYLTAIPNKGYQFNQWTDGNTDNPRQITVMGDATYTAQFGIKQCSWLVESNDLEMGAVYTTFMNEFYNYGTQITVSASPNSGYKFVKWNDGKKYNPYTFSLLDDKYLLAIFMAEEVEQETTTVQPADTTATFQWPVISGGYTYTLTIYADANCTQAFCTLTFNQYGQLTNIHFGAPSRGSHRMNQEANFVFTITGLQIGQTYYYKMETADSSGLLLNTDEGSFTTTGTPTAMAEPSFPSGKDRGETSKILKDNQLLILRDGKTYNAQGGEVK